MYRACTIAACTKFKIEFCNCELFACIKSAKKWKAIELRLLRLILPFMQRQDISKVWKPN